MRDFAHAVRRRGRTAWAKAHDRPRKVAQCGRCAFAHPTALFPYSAGATLPCGASACALALSFSNQTLWCCLAQLQSTVTFHIASKAPSITIVDRKSVV